MGRGEQSESNGMVQKCTDGSSETRGKSHPVGSGLPRKSAAGAWLGVCITQDSPTPLEFLVFFFSPSSSLGVTSLPSNQSRGLGKE